MLIGATPQLVTELILLGLLGIRLADDSNGAVDYTKFAVKTTFLVIIFCRRFHCLSEAREAQ